MTGDCYRKACRCTHGYPCEWGWIEAPPLEHNGQTYTRTTPCPTCRPELTDRIDEQAALVAARGRTR